MSGFLARWARRKSEASVGAPSRTPVAEVDPASLPALATLKSDSDFTAFLAEGVSAVLQTQALRIAWESDARIASFRGMAEYAWDFNTEGYGKLAVGDDVAALLRRVTGALAPGEVEDRAAAAAVKAVESAPDAMREPLSLAAKPEAIVAAQASGQADPLKAAVVSQPDEVNPVKSRASAAKIRRHGGALPA